MLAFYYFNHKKLNTLQEISYHIMNKSKLNINNAIFNL